MGDSSLGRLIGVLTSPRQAFEALRERPTWALALVVLLLIAGGGNQYAQSKLDNAQVTRDFMEKSGRNFTEEQIEEAITRQEATGPAVNAVLAFGAMALMAVLGAGFFWVGTKVFGGEPSYKQSLATLVHGLVPWWGVKSLLSLPALMGRTELTLEDATIGVLPSNLALFAPPEASSALLGLLSAVDVFSIWSLVLLTLGYSVVTKVSKLWTGLLVLVVWLVTTGLALLPALLFG